jgi:hypothetical protein
LFSPKNGFSISASFPWHTPLSSGPSRTFTRMARGAKREPNKPGARSRESSHRDSRPTPLQELYIISAHGLAALRKTTASNQTALNCQERHRIRYGQLCSSTVKKGSEAAGRNNSKVFCKPRKGGISQAASWAACSKACSRACERSRINGIISRGILKEQHYSYVTDDMCASHSHFCPLSDLSA